MIVNGNSHIKVVVSLEGSEQYLYSRNGELVTELHWEQYLNKDGTLSTFTFCWGNERLASGRFSSKVNLLGSWSDKDLPAKHKEDILKAFTREQANIARIALI
jgi:hypothetical protein